MKIKVLGCYGGEMPGCRTTCFMVNNKVLIDAGAITAAIPVNEQAKIDAVFLTHSHLDHVRDLGFLADNIFGMREKPVTIYGLPETIREVNSHILNDSIWPDFSKLPTPEDAVITFQEIKEGIPQKAAGLFITPVKVNHTVPAVGFIVSNENASFAVSGDTGPTQTFWEAASGIDRLRALFVEISFPNRLLELACDTCHLTPELAKKEIEKLGRTDTQVYIYHMKPQYEKEITSEIGTIDEKLSMLHQGDLLEI